MERFEADRLVLAEIMPRLRHYIWADRDGAFAEGVIAVDVGAGCWEEVEIRMNFGADYPRRPPRVYDRGRRWKPNPDRHIIVGREFCLWLAFADMPDVTTAAGLRDFLLRLVLFLRDQFVFDDIGHWPGRDWPHGRQAAYAKHLVERLRLTSTTTFDALWPLVLGSPQRPNRKCPCGSGLPYGRCHRSDVQALTWVRRLDIRNELATAVEDHFRDAA